MTMGGWNVRVVEADWSPLEAILKAAVTSMCAVIICGQCAKAATDVGDGASCVTGTTAVGGS